MVSYVAVAIHVVSCGVDMEIPQMQTLLPVDSRAYLV